jgi:hypothetical protein
VHKEGSLSSLSLPSSTFSPPRSFSLARSLARTVTPSSAAANLKQQVPTPLLRGSRSPRTAFCCRCRCTGARHGERSGRGFRFWKNSGDFVGASTHACFCLAERQTRGRMSKESRQTSCIVRTGSRTATLNIEIAAALIISKPFSSLSMRGQRVELR